MFQHRHYEVLADWLGNATLCVTDERARRLVASSLADTLQRDNPRFKRDRFLAACAKGRNWLELPQ
jgi:hypothetical protein